MLAKLLNKNDIERVFKQGNKIVSPFFVCIYLRENINETNSLVIASKKVGKAVARNKAKRLLRVTLSYIENDLKKNGISKVIMIARSPIIEIKSSDLTDIIRKKLNYIHEKNNH